MDGRQFDDLTRAFAQRTSRRAVVAGLAAGIAGALTGLGGRGTAAQRRVRQASGAACTRATECASFYCVDGFCCDASCTGQCEACNVPGREGVCTPVAGAPVGGRPACPGSGPCAATCDGVTGTLCTAYPGAETTCGAPTCADGWLTTSVCGGNGSCVPTTSSCAPFGCDATGTACAAGCTSDDDCEPGLACAGGACVPVQALGAPCTDHAECASGRCADGVCMRDSVPQPRTAIRVTAAAAARAAASTSSPTSNTAASAITAASARRTACRSVLTVRVPSNARPASNAAPKTGRASPAAPPPTARRRPALARRLPSAPTASAASSPPTRARPAVMRRATMARRRWRRPAPATAPSARRA